MNVANGNLILSATDTAIPSRGLTASITRTYNSRSMFDGPFGFGWTTELDMRLNVPTAPNGTPRGPIAYIDLDRTIHYFAQNADGSYTSPPGLYLTLVRNGDGTFSVTEKNGLVYKYSSDGKILSVTDKNNNSISYTYDTANPSRVTTITDAAGRTLSVQWRADGKVDSISNQASLVTKYNYDGAGNLISVTNAYGQTGSFTVQYAYDASHNLVSITPPAGNKTYFYYTADDRLQSINPVNSIENASFEVDGDLNNLPDYWSVNAVSSAEFTLTATPTPLFASRVFAISPNAPDGSTMAYGVYVSNSIPVSPAIQYQVSGYVKAVQTSGSHRTVLYDSTGALKNQYAYDVWGNPDTANTSETVENPYRYAGYRWDAETGLYFLNARYYAPTLGRFLTPDTWKGDPLEPWTQNSTCTLRIVRRITLIPQDTFPDRS